MTAAAVATLFAAPFTGVAFGQATDGAGGIIEAAERTRAEASYREFADLYAESVHQREKTRAEKTAEAFNELDEHLEASANESEFKKHAVEVSEAVRVLVELDVLMGDDRRDELEADERFRPTVERATELAHQAEERHEWVIAGELFGRLNALFEDERAFEKDIDRLARRLTMIRLYVPERLWELNNERRVLAGEDPFPAYNPFGDTYEEKLAPVHMRMIRAALARATYGHIEQVALQDMLRGGVDALETFVTTEDLREAFEGMGSPDKRKAFLEGLNDIRSRIDSIEGPASRADLEYVLQSITRVNDRSVDVMEQALLHEFANGALEELDKYTGVIWPDEIKRFERSTQGRFTGVGIQIEMDEKFNIRVVTPLPGTPAQKAGVAAGDVITKVNGRSIEGFTLDQAVQVITGPEYTDVTLTLERGHAADGEEDEGPIDTFPITVARRSIDLPTVKGWRKTGPNDDDWDWFVDEEAGIGYVRITNFSETTTRDFDRAIDLMRNTGLEGLVLDLRFNPGGLLDQAVSIASRFVDSGLIVKTEGPDGSVVSQENATRVPDRRRLNGIPVAVLINNGSASASEIVSGAIQAYAHEGGLDAWVIGKNSFGKGSVQNVFSIDRSNRAMMKLTTHYYKLRDDRVIHKLPGATRWGVTPDIDVEMLPDQIIEALELRRDADIFELDAEGAIVENAERPDVNKLVKDGIDLQLQRALVKIHEARAGVVAAARLDLDD
ncbi:MAG: hypothetical protein CMJ31_04790 [Phycisphaerae bacterium]|nr:hypothetical protein [Phycisphaerae bacterium]